jgi:hypothetical protein
MFWCGRNQVQVQVSSHVVAGDATVKSAVVLEILQWHGHIQVTMAGLSCFGVEYTQRTAVMPRACCDQMKWQDECRLFSVWWY